MTRTERLEQLIREAAGLLRPCPAADDWQARATAALGRGRGALQILDRREVLRLIDSGLSQAAVAERLGVSRQAIHKIVASAARSAASSKSA